MELNEFVSLFADLFEDTDPSEITADCLFHDLDEWSSLTGMSIIAMSKMQFGKAISGMEIRKCETVEDLFNLITNK